MMEARDVLTQYLGRVRDGRLLDAREEKDLSLSTADRLIQRSWSSSTGWDANWTDLGMFY